MKPKPRTIDEYLAGATPGQRATLEKLRRTIRAVAPAAEEGISYGLAAFRLNGRALVAFGAWAGHCAFYPMSAATITAFREQLKDFATSKGAIRFTPDRPLPAALVRKLVRARVAESTSRTLRATGGKAPRGGPSGVTQPVIGFAGAAEFRRWLAGHHSTHPGFWMWIAKKGSGVRGITYAEALDEALCHGWIDGQKKRLDATSWLQKFTPRRPRSQWSQINTGHVARLTRAGRMRPPGLAAVAAARADGRWARAYGPARDFEVPADFLAAVAKHAKARAFFATLSRSNRHAIFHRLTTAKKPGTRARRFQQLVAKMKRGERLH